MENHSNIIYNPTYTDEENQWLFISMCGIENWLKAA